MQYDDTECDVPTLHRFIQHLLSQKKWISVKDRIPISYKDVLVYSMGEISLAFRDYLMGHCWYKLPDSQYISGVTHWMPLPEISNE